MLLTDARRAARTGPHGELVPLDDQDRDRWDRAAIEEGVALVTRALSQGPAGPYQLRAAIAAVHDEAPSARATDWHEILGCTRCWCAWSPAPSNASTGPSPSPWSTVRTRAWPNWTWWRTSWGRGTAPDAVRGHLLERAGEFTAARAAYESAAGGTLSLPEQRYLRARAARLRP